MKTIYTKLLIALCFLASIIVSAQTEQQFNEIVSEQYKSDMPGASFLVAKNGNVIYRNAFGKSNLELDSNMVPENVFELASISKQFTAVSILMLEEQGKLSLSDPITKFIPDYPTHGKTITVHQLLNHTSGIKSYTSMDNLTGMARIDKTPKQIIDYFKNEPMDFDPGEKFLYNNSGYIILGHIIELLTDDTYENFVEKHIFEKLGMTNSRYGSKTELIKNRALGYKEDTEGYANADYISMSIPYAAGSLMSTVDDMLKWQMALTNNTLIKKSSLEKGINGSSLNNGEHISYGYGLIEIDLKGSKGYTHSGGIFGYSTNGIYLINEDIYVIGLSNCSCNDVGGVTTKLAAAALGKPFPSKKDAITLSKEKLEKWTGAYEFEDGAIRFITLSGNQLKSQREGSTVFDVYALSDDHFIFEEGTISYQFAMHKDGSKHVVMNSNGNLSNGKQIDKKAPKEKVAITISPDILNTYVGKYELQPGFIIEVSVKGNQIFAVATGQPQFEIFAETETTFFLKVVPASVDFNKNDKGEVVSLTLHQGGQDVEGKKIE